MTKTKIFLLFSLALVLFAACGDSEYEQHRGYFYPQVTGGIRTFYADQQTDSTVFYCTDNWTLTNTADWLTVKQGTQVNNVTVSVPAGYLVGTKLDLTFQPNTTGEMRGTTLTAVTASSDLGSISQYFAQSPYLNISSLTAMDKFQNEEGKDCYYQLIIPSSGKMLTGANPSLSFRLYTGDGTLTSSQSWCVPQKTSDFSYGETNNTNTVSLTVGENTAATARVATLSLTSEGITTHIDVIQEAAK